LGLEDYRLENKGGGLIYALNGLYDEPGKVGLVFHGKSGDYGRFDEAYLEQTLKDNPIDGIDLKIE
tara:strand:- start:1224 stop:1421 length:198 start_codon:yes stop_codon:yes gene_type:complete